MADTKNCIRALMGLLPGFIQEFGATHQATREVQSIIGRFGGTDGKRFNQQNLMHARNGNGSPNPRDHVRRVGGAAVAPASFTSPAKTAGLKRKMHPANVAPATVSAGQDLERTPLEDYELETVILDLLEQNYEPVELLGLIQEAHILTEEQVQDLRQAAQLSPEEVADILEKRNRVDVEPPAAEQIAGAQEAEQVEPPAAETAAAPEYLTDAELRALKGKSVGNVAKEVGRVKLFATLLHLGQEVNEGWNDSQAAKQLLKLVPN